MKIIWTGMDEAGAHLTIVPETPAEAELIERTLTAGMADRGPMEIKMRMENERNHKDELPQPILTLEHSDTVSGLTIFNDGAKCYWSEGPGVEIQVIRADGARDTEFEDGPHAIAMEDGIAGPHRGMTAWEELEFDAVRNGWSERDARRIKDAMDLENDR